MDGDVLRRMQRHGFDFSKEHAIDFFAILPSRRAAESVAKTFDTEKKTAVALQPEADKPGTQVTVIKTMHATYENITSFESKFGRIVEANGGYLDGWGVMH